LTSLWLERLQIVAATEAETGDSEYKQPQQQTLLLLALNSSRNHMASASSEMQRAFAHCTWPTVVAAATVKQLLPSTRHRCLVAFLGSVRVIPSVESAEVVHIDSLNGTPLQRSEQQ